MKQFFEFIFGYILTTFLIFILLILAVMLEPFGSIKALFKNKIETLESIENDRH